MSNLQLLVQKQAPAIEAALPKHIDSDRMVRIALTAIRTNPKLQQCNPQSFLGSLMTAAQLGLEVNTPLQHAYIIPYKTEAQFQLGYKGLLDLCYRTGLYADIDAHNVYENDHFEYNLGLDPRLDHKPANKDRGEVIAYYAYYRLKDGGKSFRVWTKDEVTDHAKKYSQSFNRSSSPWKTNFDAMARKTVLKDVLRYAPMSPEDKNSALVAQAIASDNAILISDKEKPELIDTTFGDPKEIETENIEAEAVETETDKAIEELG